MDRETAKEVLYDMWEQEKVLDASLQLFSNMLLLNKIKISDIPQAVRVYRVFLYIAAFRSCGEFEVYIDNLKTLMEDLRDSGETAPNTRYLKDIFQSRLRNCPFSEGNEFENFKKTVPPHLLL